MANTNPNTVNLPNIDAIAAQALAHNEALTSLLANGVNSIYHEDAPENGQYPLIQYQDVSTSPVLHADNKLNALEKVIRVTIINNTNIGKHALKEAVYNAMVDAGFMWEMTTNTRDGKEIYTSLDFSYGVEV